LSKRSKPIRGQKRPKKIVFYLDRNLCAEEILQPLRNAGYKLIAYTDEFGRVFNQRVSDPDIIKLCGERKHILITGDSRLEYTYAAEIFAAKVGVVLLSTNNGGAESWKRRLIAALPEIREQIHKRKKPYLIRVALDGTLTTIRLYSKQGSKSYFLYG
jgi:hypothetical protein